MPANSPSESATVPNPASTSEAKGEKNSPQSAKEARVTELLTELDGKSETTQRPVIDEIVAMGPVAIKPLARALGSGASFQVRMASATGLGELGDPSCVAPLVMALADSSLNVQRAAVHALSLLGEPAVAPLLESINSPEDSVRRWSAEVLGKLGRKEVADVLIAKLPEEVIDVQKSLVIALGELRDTKATPVLLPFLDNENVDLVRHAAEALGRIGDARAIDPLIRCLDSPSIDVRKVVASALVDIGAESVPALTIALRHHNHNVRMWVAEALGSLKDKGAVNALILALKDENVRVRRYAALALGEIGDPKAAKSLQTLLTDSVQDVRYSAVKAVADIGGKASLQPLTTALHDPDWVVRLAAAKGLGQLNDKAAVPALCEALKDSEWSVRYHAALSLGDLSDLSAVIPLIKALKDPREGVRRGVVESLGRLGDRRAVAALERQRKTEETDSKLVVAMIDMVLPGLRRGRKFEPRPDQRLTPQPIINTATIKPKAAILAAQENAARIAAEAAAAANLEDELPDGELDVVALAGDAPADAELVVAALGDVDLPDDLGDGAETV
ncbi:MAG: HEAT repeat domain-containing protein [Armatimonadetes bacterium]|nr:HEAT repeat domain-containing protein [Armatimonadota bacterium]